MDDIQQNVREILARLREYEIKYQRQPGSVQLLAVTKNQSLEKMQQAIAAGQRAFGENYLQEALLKIAALKNQPLAWHFIGHIQSNKTQKISENFSWVHSVSEKKIAKRLNDQRPPALPPLNICIEVNISHEKTKSGIDVTEAAELAEYCLTLPRLKLRGLMTIPAPQQEFAAQRAAYHQLRILWQQLCDLGMALDTLSMGMSNDMEAAVAEGATIVRIGTSLFGKRTI